MVTYNMHASAQPPRVTADGTSKRALGLVALAGALLYLVGICTYRLAQGSWPPGIYAAAPLLLLLVAIAAGRGRQFLLDFGLFPVLVLSWQVTTQFTGWFGQPVHVGQLVRAESWLFRGHLPTLELQQRLFTGPGHARWYDWVGIAQYGLHFILPVGVGALVWSRSRRTYWRYLASVMTLFYLGFVGYALYPAAPPWMAGLQGATPPIHRVTLEVLLGVPTSSLADISFGVNDVAAMPSLHAGLPLLLALVLLRLWGRKAVPALVYPLVMAFSLVYLGEHYVVDVLAGYGVALVAYGLVWVLPDALRLRQPRTQVGTLTRASRRVGRVRI